jgi:uncharacterized protein (TIRG00374 family)
MIEIKQGASSMPKNHPTHQRLIRPLLWSVIVAVVVYGGFVIFSDLGAVGASAAKLGVIGWITILSLSLANYVLRFVRWEHYLHLMNHSVPPLLSLVYYFGGFAFATTPGKAGEAIRSFYLKRHGVPYVQSLAAFFTERFVDLVAMIVLSLVAALSFPAYRWPVVIITLVIIVLLPLIHAKGFHAFLDKQRTRLRSERLRVIGSHLLALLRSASRLLKSGPLYVGLLLSVVAWGAEGVAFHVILDALGIQTSLLLAVGIYSISILSGALSFIPGGLGSTEAIMVLLLKLSGSDMPSAIAATLICRLSTLWFAVGIGAAMVAFLEIRPKRQFYAG